LFVLANGVTYWVLISRLLFPLTGNAGPSGPGGEPCCRLP
jgi:hypothetical protein